MLVGIISERTDREKKKHRSLFKGYTAERFLNHETGLEIIAVCIPYTAAELEALTPRRKKRTMEKALSKLRRYGPRSIVLSAALSEYREEWKNTVGIKASDGADMFCGFIPKMVRTASEMCGLRLIDARVGIAASKVDRITEYLIRELCFDTRQMILYTDAADTCSDFFENLFDETGFLPEVRNAARCDSGRDEVFIDRDRRVLRVGRDVTVTGIEGDFDIGGYKVNAPDIAACLDDKKFSQLCLKYKNGRFVLTLPKV